MTLLDDYETEYKLQGVIIVEEMLRRVPNDLLKRTGVDGLFRQVRLAINTCWLFFFLQGLFAIFKKSLSVTRCRILRAQRLLVS